MKFPIANDIFSKNEILKLFFYIKENFKLNLALSSNKIRHYKGSINDSKITFTKYLQDDDFIKKNYGISSILTDYFVEDIRVLCKNINFEYSPFDYFNKNKSKITKIFNNLYKYKVEKKKSNLNKIEEYILFRSILYKHTKQCDTFPYFVCLSIYYTFKPRKVLDMSAGWGDRLISALMYEYCDYTGIDPNSKLEKRYKKIIDTFKNKKLKNKFKVIKSPFEDVILEDKYDLMFSSPPYFIAEHYSKDTDQAYIKYSNLNNWLNNFIFKSIDKIWLHLETGGFLIMVINDTRIKNEIVHFTEKIMNYIRNKIGSRFLKMLKYQTKSTIQPIWVFQKIPNIQKNILDSPYIISRVNLYNKNFNVIREDLLISGPIQRIIEKILRDIKEHNLFLRCKINEYSQVALSYGCFILKKKCHLILNKQYDNKLHKLSILAKIFGAKIHFIERQTDKNIEKKNISNITSKYQDSYIFRYGFFKYETSMYYIDIFRKLKETIGNPKVIWLVYTKEIVLNSLTKVFDKTFFNIILKVDNQQNYPKSGKVKIFIAKQNKTELYTNYSHTKYDNKIWDFLQKYGKNEDYIFNISNV